MLIIALIWVSLMLRTTAVNIIIHADMDDRVFDASAFVSPWEWSKKSRLSFQQQ